MSEVPTGLAQRVLKGPRFRMNKMSRFFALPVAAALVGLTSAHAVPMLRVFDGTTTLTFADNGAGDLQPAAGQVLFAGSIGNWFLNVHTGTTYPVLGTLTNPYLDLSFNATSRSAGTLAISFSADGFGPSSGGTEMAIGGTASTSGQVTYQAFGGTNNTLFSTSNLLGAMGPFSGTAFSGTLYGGAVNNQGPYSLTQLVTIVHNASGQTTGDAMLRVPEGGSTVLLLGLAVFAVGIFVRLRHRTP